MSLLAFSQIAAERGDGLHPMLRRLFEQRVEIETNPRIVELAVLRPGEPLAAGSCPAASMGLFLPGNVVRLVAPAQTAIQPQTTSKTVRG